MWPNWSVISRLASPLYERKQPYSQLFHTPMKKSRKREIHQEKSRQDFPASVDPGNCRGFLLSISSPKWCLQPELAVRIVMTWCKSAITHCWLTKCGALGLSGCTEKFSFKTYVYKKKQAKILVIFNEFFNVFFSLTRQQLTNISRLTCNAREVPAPAVQISLLLLNSCSSC